jgi:hypothetical protein
VALQDDLAGWLRNLPDKPMADHGMHSWWYRYLAAPGVVSEGTTSGERMHTGGQSLLGRTGNLNAVQKRSGTRRHRPPGDVHVDGGIDQLAATMADALRDEDHA